MDEVAKHVTKEDCWVVLDGKVLNVTKFLPDHPGGELAILTFAGKDATAEFNMIHPPDVVGKYAPDAVIGDLSGGGGDLEAGTAVPAAAGGASAPLLSKPAASAPKFPNLDGMSDTGKVKCYIGTVLTMLYMSYPFFAMFMGEFAPEAPH